MLFAGILWVSFFTVRLVAGGPNLQATFSSPNKGPVITPEFSEFVAEILKTSNINGLSLTVVRKEDEAEYGAWGRRTEAGDAMTPTTLFHLASCSKAFLATAFGILMADFASGKNTTALPPGVIDFNWNTKVKDIMPAEYEWGFMDQWAYEKANIRDILSHVSGLPRHHYSYGPKDHAEDVIKRMKFLRPAFELRQQWSYNNLMFIMSAHIISHYTGSYTSFVKDRIFNPLNMSSTTFYPSEAVQSGEMTQAWTKNGRRIPQWFTDDMVDLCAGPGGIISNGEDMAKWVKTLLNFGFDSCSNTTVIPRSVFDAVTTAHAIISGEPGQPVSGYGMGWGRTSYQGHDVITHGGGIPGFSTLVAFLPSAGLGIVVLINGDNKAQANDAVFNRVVGDVLDLGHDFAHKIEPSHPQKPLQCNAATSLEMPTTLIALQKYTGTYSNIGYGSFVLCDSTNAGNSSYCAQVLSDFDAVDSHKSHHRLTTEPRLLASWSRLWASHVRLIHVSGSSHHFNVQLTVLFPEGYGDDKTPFETFEAGQGEALAQFVMEDEQIVGLGVFGVVGDLTKRREKTVQGQAEIWFDKIE